MAQLHNLGFPRVGKKRELKFAVESYWAGKINQAQQGGEWVNPDYGLKTRGWEETRQTLDNMVKATKELREELQ
ncbi:hypothetical protein PSOS111911_17820 [Pseudoalteromonas ostreae]|nr:hypothetical protein [Pseudoalteromonas ostreae]